MQTLTAVQSFVLASSSRRHTMIRQFPDHFRSIDMRRRTMLRLTLAIFTILTLSFGPAVESTRASGGWLQFKNETSSRVYVAVLYLDEARCGTDGWTQRGWWTIQPGETVSTIQMSSKTHYYYYAETSDGHSWPSEALTSYVPNSEFTDCYGNVRPDLPGYHRVGMMAIKVEDTDRGHVISLTPIPGSLDDPCGGGLSCDHRTVGVSPPDDCPWYNPFC